MSLDSEENVAVGQLRRVPNDKYTEDHPSSSNALFEVARRVVKSDSVHWQGPLILKEHEIVLIVIELSVTMERAEGDG